MKPDKTIMVGLSGGVDSAVAALLLQQQGWRVEGLFMKNWEEDDQPGHCSAAEDLQDARQVAERLAIPLHTANFSDAYWERVFTHFLAEYRAGRTPNPDLLCNREIKFRAFLDHALDLGAEAIATGHYARRCASAEGWQLCRAVDEGKDQTYFLYLLNQQQLAHAHFPLADYPKQAVRELALQAGFANARKKESTGICFIGERPFRQFLQRYLPAQPGDIVTPEGAVIGSHCGLMYYTLGQRKGLGIGGQAGYHEGSWYVVEKDLATNRLLVAQQHDHPLLLKAGLEAEDLHWITAPPPPRPGHLLARLRHRQPLQPCTLLPLADGRCRVWFEHPQRAVTPGQAIVFYHHHRCLGGGTIVRGLNREEDASCMS